MQRHASNKEVEVSRFEDFVYFGKLWNFEYVFFFVWGGAWVFKSICRFKELRDLGYLGNLAYFESLGYLGNLVKLEDSGY